MLKNEAFVQNWKKLRHDNLTAVWLDQSLCCCCYNSDVAKSSGHAAIIWRFYRTFVPIENVGSAGYPWALVLVSIMICIRFTIDTNRVPGSLCSHKRWICNVGIKTRSKRIIRQRKWHHFFTLTRSLAVCINSRAIKGQSESICRFTSRDNEIKFNLVSTCRIPYSMTNHQTQFLIRDWFHSEIELWIVT